MPRLHVDRGTIYFEETGHGDQTVVFSHGLLWNHRLFEAQIAHLSARYRCIAYDHRGQGQSDVPAGPAIDMETLYLDAVRLIEARAAAPCHFVGLSMGGFVGLRLAARRPDLVASLTLLDTAADAEPTANLLRYRLLTATARLLGVGVVADQVAPIMFGDTFLGDPSRRRERQRWMSLLAGNKRSVYKAVNGVIFRPGVEREALTIKAPTLIIWGEEDRAISRDRCADLARLVADSRFVTIPRAGHSCPVEQPDAVNQAIDAFLADYS